MNKIVCIHEQKCDVIGICCAMRLMRAHDLVKLCISTESPRKTVDNSHFACMHFTSTVCLLLYMVVQVYITCETLSKNSLTVV